MYVHVQVVNTHSHPRVLYTQSHTWFMCIHSHTRGSFIHTQSHTWFIHTYTVIHVVTDHVVLLLYTQVRPEPSVVRDVKQNNDVTR